VTDEVTESDGSGAQAVGGCGCLVAVVCGFLALGASGNSGGTWGGVALVAIIIAAIGFGIGNSQKKKHAAAAAQAQAVAALTPQPPAVSRELAAFEESAERDAQRWRSFAGPNASDVELQIVASAEGDIRLLVGEVAALEEQVRDEATRTGSGWNSPTEQRLDAARIELSDKALRLRKLADAKEESAQLAADAALDQEYKLLVVRMAHIANLRDALMDAYGAVYADLAARSAVTGMPDPTSATPVSLPRPSLTSLLPTRTHDFLNVTRSDLGQMTKAGRNLDPSCISQVEYLDNAVLVALERLTILDPSVATEREVEVRKATSLALPQDVNGID